MPRLEGVAPSACGRVSVGVDLVRVADVAESIAAFGQRYLDRVYTPAEVAYSLADGGSSDAPARHLAARFAAKEATAKALQSGDEPLDWRQIEVERHGDGSCGIRLHGAARALARRRGALHFAVSLTHERDYAAAVVVSQCAEAASAAARLPRTTPTGAYER
jgi:holo-[acyl-carrier protein] synthase